MKQLNEFVNEAKLNEAERIFEIITKVYRGTGAHGGKEADNIDAVIKLFDEVIYYVKDMLSSDDDDNKFSDAIKNIADKSVDDFKY